MSFGWLEITIVLAIILILFGGAKIPQLMRSAGKGVSDFNKELDKVRRQREEDQE